VPLVDGLMDQLGQAPADWKAEHTLSDGSGTVDWSTPGRATPRRLSTNSKQAQVGAARSFELGCEPGRAHDARFVPCTVLDPFVGSGTTALVADELGRAPRHRAHGLVADEIFEVFEGE
jgi:hypothetical protein